MKITAVAALAALASVMLGVSMAQAGQCPIGSHPSVDSWGNKICERFSDGSTATTEVPSGHSCPIGSHPWVDAWGNKICRSEGSASEPRTDYYDTSKGCPTGTYRSVDSYGNKTCKKF
jgi:hypothetical protein